MSARCDLLVSKKKMIGHNVSHSNRRTIKTFKINLHTKSYHSKLLGTDLTLKLSSNTMRTIDKYGGIDEFVINSRHKNLTEYGQSMRRRFRKINEIKNLITVTKSRKRVTIKEPKESKRIIAIREKKLSTSQITN